MIDLVHLQVYTNPNFGDLKLPLTRNGMRKDAVLDRLLRIATECRAFLVTLRRGPLDLIDLSFLIALSLNLYALFKRIWWSQGCPSE